MVTLKTPTYSKWQTLDDSSELDLQLPTLKVVSYRGPGHSAGVSANLEPIVHRLQGKVHWFALRAQPDATNPNTPFLFYTPQATKPMLDQYESFCSDYLWPLFHGNPERAKFDPECWKSFKQLSELIAAETLNVSAESFPTLCWVHDYHMALVSALMSAHAGIILSHFWHISWPSPEVIVDSPIGKDFVQALLANRTIGFHTEEYANNFLLTVSELLPDAQVDHLKTEIKLGRHITKVVVMPLGIDVSLWESLAQQSRSLADALVVRYSKRGPFLLGIDRFDYTKGVLEKLAGVELFLKTNPKMLKKFQYVQIAYPEDHPSTSSLEYAEQVRAEVAKINAKYGSGDWQPIVLKEGFLDKLELAAWYQASDVLMVNSLKDGLNLIAKEFVACRRDDTGALILSRNTGCTAELAEGAILVDPTDAEEIAQALKSVMQISKEEKRKRMSPMRRMVNWNKLQDWALRFLKQSLIVRVR